MQVHENVSMYYYNCSTMTNIRSSRGNMNNDFYYRLYLTCKYMFHVKGYYEIPKKNMFPYRMGCTQSDMFTISLPCYYYNKNDHNSINDKNYSKTTSKNEYYSMDGISLSEYHTAFLCSPIFQYELWILQTFGITGTNINPITLTNEHLHDVALGNHSSFGPWTTWAVHGSRTIPIPSCIPTKPTSTNSDDNEVTTTTTTTPCVIMRCRTRYGPFCDTWWAIELEDDEVNNENQPKKVRHPQLIFGTSLIQSQLQKDTDSNNNNNDTTQKRKTFTSTKSMFKSIVTNIMTPFHRLYSRILLANCKATLIIQSQKYHTR